MEVDAISVARIIQTPVLRTHTHTHHYHHLPLSRYANRAKNITNKPHINEDPKDALLREYQEEIMRLKMTLDKRKKKGGGKKKRQGGGEGSKSQWRLYSRVKFLVFV